jgi:hypothetical protein
MTCTDRPLGTSRLLREQRASSTREQNLRRALSAAMKEVEVEWTVLVPTGAAAAAHTSRSG